MDIGSYKRITINLDTHEAWILEQILNMAKDSINANHGDDSKFYKFNSSLLTDLSKERVK